MFKFRTMVQDAEALQAGLEDRNEAQGPVFKISADPRVTPVGRFLRRTSLDELPQLVTVLRGRYVARGPAPARSARRAPVRGRVADAPLQRAARPDLPLAGERPQSYRFDEWVRLDLDYIDNWSLALDMRILLKTVPVVLSGSGAM
jgi:lipopolysaccharide/colanic/teichoic acid biosynthesis glycosyltransferase